MRPFNICSVAILCPELLGVLFILRSILLPGVACHIFSSTKALGECMLNLSSLFPANSAVTAAAWAFISPMALISLPTRTRPSCSGNHASCSSFFSSSFILIRLDMLYVSIPGLEFLKGSDIYSFRPKFGQGVPLSLVLSYTITILCVLERQQFRFSCLDFF
uniref:Uncharacterized protein n=1 Tax=Hordeum vulgare subsp. vulgare TaxID=112509 RepID=A0A8I6X448_HORVV